MYNLLIVDDEPLVRRGIKSLVDFTQLNIESVFEATNGKEALDIMKDQHIDFILADINMPKMDGLTFADKAKQVNPHIRIALITGYDYFDYAVQALKIGVDDYILKPVSKNDVMEVLKKLINKHEKALKHIEVEKSVNQLMIGAENAEDSLKLIIKNIFDEELDNPEFSLKSLGHQMGYSSGHLSGLFKKHFGSTFQDYLLSQRLERAKLLLLTTNMKNYEIAERIGFVDVNYFGTRFKKHFGESPKQFKERVSTGHEVNS